LDIRVKIGTQDYGFTLGSDVTRDGMLEAGVTGGSTRRTIAEIFYSHAIGQFMLTCFEENLPLELVEYLIAEGRKCLPPSGDRDV
jgi:hypothetical protein